jgi:hypothetical protein
MTDNAAPNRWMRLRRPGGFTADFDCFSAHTEAFGKRTIKLMRYQCRPAGKPKFLDKDLYTFNARRDNLGGN